MTYEDAIDAIIEAFHWLDGDSEKIQIMELYLKEEYRDVTIFPMKEFNAFCVKHWKDDFRDFAEQMEDSRSFNFNDRWCLYDKDACQFESSEDIEDFAYDEEELAKFIANDFEMMWDGLLFTPKEANEVAEALSQDES